MREAGIVMVGAGFGISALVGYLLGSVDFAIMVSRLFYKKDIRTVGSGNAGMTNMLRSFGKKAAAFTLLGDVAKGIVSVLLGHLIFGAFVPGAETVYGAYVAGIFAILGHLFPLYFGFKGGKGIAVSGGVIIALQPLLAAILLAVFLLLVKVTGMVSLGSVIGIGLYPVATLVYTVVFSHAAPVFSTLCSFIISLLVIFMHRANIKRIIQGTEYRFGQKNKTETGPEPEDKSIQ